MKDEWVELEKKETPMNQRAGGKGNTSFEASSYLQCFAAFRFINNQLRLCFENNFQQPKNTR